jgi:hypothetical protein
LRKFQRILQRSSLALQSFQLLNTVLLLLLILLMEVETITMTVVTTNLLILLVLLGRPDWLVLPVTVMVPRAEVEVAAVVVIAVQQVLLASQLLQIPTRLCLFRPSPLSGTLSISGIDKPQLLVLPS